MINEMGIITTKFQYNLKKKKTVINKKISKSYLKEKKKKKLN